MDVVAAVTLVRDDLQPKDYLAQYRGYFQRQRVTKLNASLPTNLRLPVPTQPDTKSRVESLKRELNTAKSKLDNQLIVELHNQLGEQYIASEHWQDAKEIFTACLSYVNDASRKCLCNMNLIRVALFQKELDQATRGIREISPLVHDLPVEERNLLISQLNCILGLIKMQTGRFTEAFTHFSQATSVIGNTLNEFLVPSDLACFLSLTALVSTDRSELSKMINSETYHSLFSVVPPLYTMLSSFYYRDFYTTITIVPTAIKQISLLPLGSFHTPQLHSLIFSSCIRAYLEPYSSVSFSEMGKEFNLSQSEAEEKISRMIIAGEISGVIDVHNHVFMSSTSSQRHQTLSLAVSELKSSLDDLLITIFQRNVAVRKGESLFLEHRKHRDDHLIPRHFGMHSPLDEQFLDDDV